MLMVTPRRQAGHKTVGNLCILVNRCPLANLRVKWTHFSSCHMYPHLAVYFCSLCGRYPTFDTLTSVRQKYLVLNTSAHTFFHAFSLTSPSLCCFLLVSNKHSISRTTSINSSLFTASVANFVFYCSEASSRVKANFSTLTRREAEVENIIRVHNTI